MAFPLSGPRIVARSSCLVTVIRAPPGRALRRNAYIVSRAMQTNNFDYDIYVIGRFSGTLSFVN